MARAKREGFRSRAAFKLIEIDDKHHVLKPGARVVDLAPRPAAGARSRRSASARAGASSRIDVLKMDPIAGVDFEQTRFSRSRRAGKVQSHARRSGRCGVVRHGGQRHRTPPDRSSQDHGAGRNGGGIRRRGADDGGAFLAKVIQGGTESALLATLKRDFATVKHVKPAASRADSAELYVLATGFRGAR